MPTRARFWTFSLTSLLVACSSNDVGEAVDEPVGVTVDSIIGGVPATSYPEAAVLDDGEGGGR